MMMLKMFMPVSVSSLILVPASVQTYYCFGLGQSFRLAELFVTLLLFQSMPKMPESEKKEESAESREEAKEQVSQKSKKV